MDRLLRASEAWEEDDQIRCGKQFIVLGIGRC